MREQELIERLSAAVASNGRQSPHGPDLEDCSDPDVASHLKTGIGPDGGGGGCQQGTHQQQHQQHQHHAPVQPLITIPPPPRSPLKSVVRAYLPNEQRTIVQVKPGQTVREALSKAMKLRKLDPSTCAVYRCTPPEVLLIMRACIDIEGLQYLISHFQSKVQWDADISSVEGGEIRVKLKENLSVTTSISHNFVSSIFVSIPFGALKGIEER